MTVCNFYLRGQCRFGAACRFEHPADKNQPVFGGSNNTWSNASRVGGSSGSGVSVPFSLDTLSKDIEPSPGEKPLWPLSSYGPAKHEPNISPAFDESFEELRFKAFQARIANTAGEYIKYEDEKTAAANNYYTALRSKHKELYEHAKKQSSSGGTQAPVVTPTPFDPTATVSHSAFGVQSAFSGAGGQTSAFGSGGGGGSAFGQSANPAFNKTSVFSGGGGGTGGGSAFGQPSAFGQTGQPSSVGPSSAFALPTQTMTASPFATAPFGQTAAAAASPFGQQQPHEKVHSVFGNQAPPSAFSQPGFGSPFGAAAAAPPPPAQAQGSGSGGGGGGSNSAFAAFAGAQPSAFGGTSSSAAAAPPTASVFGQQNQQQQQQQQQQPQSVFGQSAFSNAGAGSAFGATPQPASAFASSANAAAPAASAFSTFTSTGPPPAPPSSSSSPFSSSPFSAPTPAAPAQTKPGVPGRPDFTLVAGTARPDAYDALLPPNYASMLPEKVRAAFASASFDWASGVPDWVPPVESR